MVDHNVPTSDRRFGIDDPESKVQVDTLAENAREFGVEYFDELDRRQGIVHIVGPEQGFTLPGMTIVCGDSHTSTHGAFGALAHGIGTSEVEHVLATQTLIQQKAKNMLVRVDGQLPPGVTAKDIILAIIGEIGTAGGTGHVIEFAGEAIRSLSMEGRMTVCNMTIEGGARAGLIAPDEKTFEYVKDRPRAPKGAAYDHAVEYWKTLFSDADAVYDKVVVLDAAKLPPIVSWGSSPEDVISVNGVVPNPDDIQDANKRASKWRALEYMGLEARHEDHRHQRRARLPRLVHQWPHRGPARRRQGGRGQEGRAARQRHGRSGLRPRQGTGGSRRAGPGVQGRRLRLARARLFHVPCHERRQAEAAGALRLDLEPQLRRPPGLQGPHPPGVASHGRRRSDRRPFRRHPRVELSFAGRRHNATSPLGRGRRAAAG